jgi:hypothetical protein
VSPARPTPCERPGSLRVTAFENLTRSNVEPAAVDRALWAMGAFASEPGVQCCAMLALAALSRHLNADYTLRASEHVLSALQAFGIHDEVNGPAPYCILPGNIQICATTTRGTALYLHVLKVLYRRSSSAGRCALGRWRATRPRMHAS